MASRTAANPPVAAVRQGAVANSGHGMPVFVGVDPDQNNVVRLFSLSLGLVLIFLRVSAFHQVQTYIMHVNLRLLYLFGIPAVLGTLLCGGVRRAFRGSPAYLWTGYAIWMTLAVPFSSWRSDSLHLVSNYLRTNLVMVVIAGGLTVGWKECERLIRWCFWGAIGSLMVAEIFKKADYGARFSLELGTVSNPNDFACHMLFCLPFILWMAISSKWIVIRLACLAGIAYGLLVIIQTGSRGGLVGIAAVVLAAVIWGTTGQKLAVVLAIPLAIASVTLVVPGKVVQRILSFSASSSDASAEALESSASRRYLFQKSVEYTLSHPLFGVGPGQFPSYEGQHSNIMGTHGQWHSTHNTFTQVSAECGIPALIFFLGGTLASFRLFYKVYRQARARSDCADIRNMAFCLMLCMIGFVVSFTFLNFAYLFYHPMLGGLAVAVSIGAKEEFARRDQIASQVRIPEVIPPPAGLRVRPASY